MPLLLRTVDPVHVSRGTIPERFPVPNDLEAVANGTLSNIIRQLSSLSHHAEELFLDLIQVGSEIANRANNLQARIDRLAVKVGQIDSVQDEYSMQDSLHTKPFSSSLNFNQQVVSRSSLPPAMEKKYQLCDKPPPLDKLNIYREDGKDGLKFYTDPSYFFDLWRQEMLKDTERAMDKNKKPHKVKNDGQNRHKKRVRQPHNTRERQRHIVLEQGEVLMPPGNGNHRKSDSANELNDTTLSEHNSTPSGKLVNLEFDGHNSEYNNRYMASAQQYEYGRYIRAESDYSNASCDSPNYRNKIPVNGYAYRPLQPPPAPPNDQARSSAVYHHSSGTPNSTRTPSNNGRPVYKDLRMSRNALPPPPPLPHEDNMHDLNGGFPPPLNEEVADEVNANIGLNDDLPLPPPPEIPDADEELASNGALAPPPPPLPLTINQLTNQVQHNNNGIAKPKPIASTSNNKAGIRDGRSELLKAIRDGIELRKVETRNDVRTDEKPSNYHDVASILARRVAVEMSDSDSGSSEYDSDGWDETSA